MKKTVSDYNAYIATQHANNDEAAEEMAEMGVDVGASELAYEVAQGALDEHSWISDLYDERGITDKVGRLTDDICCGGKL